MSCTAGSRSTRTAGAITDTADLFANRRANRMKVLVHDGIGIWFTTNPT